MNNGHDLIRCFILHPSSFILPLRDVIGTSRPLLWLNTAVLWVLGLLVLERAPTWADLVMIGYFTLPFNLWLHGINDVYDYESDLLNVRKGSDEGALLPRAMHGPMVRAMLLWNVPFWLVVLWQGTALAIVLLGVFLFLGWAYSAPPIRGKSRPFLDSAINSAYIFPYLIALAWHDAPARIWVVSLPAIVAFVAWSVASHAFTSIQDIEADRRGGVSTVATFLGARRTSWFALFFYLIAILAIGYYGWQWALLVALYPLLVGWYLAAPSRERANQLYRWFILLNASVGFIVTTVLAVSSPPNTLWAAIVVLSLVALVAAALGWGRYGERMEKERPTPILDQGG
ncbi:MAG: UbiA family prenyltransferase [Chloroflexota bacterium]|nr:UbiA family prenyltransferase [Chloroflexota bacterium]